LICLHYAKREFETLFVHRFSAATMPARNIFKNSFHYWILSGAFLGYFAYGPTSPTAGAIHPILTTLGLLSYAVGELGNLNAHLILRSLRSSGGKERGIPRGLGFNIVTCPNYMFEALVWIGVSLVTRSWATVIFAVISVGQMALWAKKKERRYRREFGDKYKNKRFVIFPGLY
jgi:very-long-chain enoyl-CoA reductase